MGCVRAGLNAGRIHESSRESADTKPVPPLIKLLHNCTSIVATMQRLQSPLRFRHTTLTFERQRSSSATSVQSTRGER